MRRLLHGGWGEAAQTPEIVSSPEDKRIAELQERVLELKRRLGAVIVAHNYQRPEVQDVADFVSDSLELARKCVEVGAPIIVFCGVRFMAETAAVLNPKSKVFLAEETAGCPMADMIDVQKLREWKKRYPGAAVVCYVNSTAEVKAESDICCTSANAIKVVESIPHKEVLFVPDYNLGHFVSTKTNKRIILYPGYCHVHVCLTPQHIVEAKKIYPEAKVVVHPECIPEVVKLADAVLSTTQMIRYVRGSNGRVFLIGTEEGIIYRMRKENPYKEFHLLYSGMVCPDMKKTRLETVLKTMQELRNVVTVPEEVGKRARLAISRMLSL